MNASGSRKLVLERIRAAARDHGPAADSTNEVSDELTRKYVRRGSMKAGAKLERMAERLREYDAEVAECECAGAAGAIEAQLAASGRQTFVAPPGLPAEWRARGFEWKIDHDLPVDEIERADGVVTECFCGVAESGTIVLHHSATEGRRAITLLPDWHLCILRASQIVETLPEYFDRCQTAGNKGTREQGNENAGIEGRETTEAEVGPSGVAVPELPPLVTWISGPSATSDIEMTRIKGVHGPRFLHVLIVKG